MNNDSVIKKVWWVLYPLLVYFLLDLLIVWLIEYMFSIPASAEAANVSAMGAVVFQIAAIIVCWYIYRKDYVEWKIWIYKKPVYFLILILIGILASHGLSALVSIMNIDSLVGDYKAVEAFVFSASPVLVVLQTVILAPASEELLFRGIMYNRLETIFGNFWLPALISSAVFGIYHFNLAQGIFAFLFGLLLCAVYDKVRNLWACYAMHAGGNLISVILVYSGFTYSSPAVYITVMIICLAGAFALYYFLVRPVRNRE